MIKYMRNKVKKETNNKKEPLGRDLENKDPEIYRQFTMSLLLTAFILSIPFSLLVITVTTDDI